jgi:hypothetical protein
LAEVLGGRPGQSVLRLFGAAGALLDAIGATLEPADRSGHERLVAATGAVLDETTFAAAWAEGRALSVEAAIALAESGSNFPQNSDDSMTLGPYTAPV